MQVLIFYEKCDDPGEEEVAKLLEKGNSKADEPEQEMKVRHVTDMITCIVCYYLMMQIRDSTLLLFC